MKCNLCGGTGARSYTVQHAPNCPTQYPSAIGGEVYQEVGGGGGGLGRGKMYGTGGGNPVKAPTMEMLPACGARGPSPGQAFAVGGARTGIKREEAGLTPEKKMLGGVRFKVFNKITNVEITDKETRFVVVDREGNVIIVEATHRGYELYFIDKNEDDKYRVEVIE